MIQRGELVGHQDQNHRWVVAAIPPSRRRRGRGGGRKTERGNAKDGRG